MPNDIHTEVRVRGGFSVALFFPALGHRLFETQKKVDLQNGVHVTWKCYRSVMGASELY